MSHADTGFSIQGFAEAAEAAAKSRGGPPVESWNPPFCGDIPMHIAADGTWFYQGTPIGREKLVKLFASILVRDEAGEYHLVTPGEKVRITVEDLPFVAVEARFSSDQPGARLMLRTNVDDWIEVGGDHPVTVEVQHDGEPQPSVHVRRNLWARVARPVFYDLAERAQTKDGRYKVDVANQTIDLGPVQ
jgi:hypothetical protein